MAEPIQSTNPKRSEWFRTPPLFGLQTAPWRVGQGFEWGKRHTIEYLIRLASEWVLHFRIGQVQQYGNSAPILLGDIGPEGGAQSKLGQLMIQKKWHKSHNSGVDLDLYVIRKDGQPEPTSIDDVDNPNANYVGSYDRARTTELAKVIHRAARPGEIVQVFFDDYDVINALRPLGITTMGPDTGRIDLVTKKLIQPPTPHKDHFHVRLKA